MSDNFLAQCEQERLHLSGAIQDHGALLAIDGSGRIVHVSANIEDFLGQSPRALLGSALGEPLSDLVAELPAAPGSRKFLAAGLKLAAGVFDLSIVRAPQGEAILEITRTPGQRPKEVARFAKAVDASDDGELQSARQRVIEEIARVTGAHRVLYYSFREEGDGEVLNEVRRDDIHGSYLGLRFPASDIPQIARTLYLKNPWRMIGDARKDAVPVLSASPAPLDLTWSDLRSVAEVHRIYMGNMGVVGSLSFPIVLNGELDALISVHELGPLTITRSLLENLAQYVRDFNFWQITVGAQRRIRMIDNLSRRFDDLSFILMRHGDLVSAWPEMAPDLLREFRADGAVLCDGKETWRAGVGFDDPAFGVFDAWFCGQPATSLWSSDHLSRQVPGLPVSQVAGVMALRIRGARGMALRVYLTRCEHVYEVAWGGNPNKPQEFHDGSLGIAPRRSFEKWVERRVSYCRPWETETRLLGFRLREVLQKSVGA